MPLCPHLKDGRAQFGFSPKQTQRQRSRQKYFILDMIPGRGRRERKVGKEAKIDPELALE
jgi:hypothetical protein